MSIQQELLSLIIFQNKKISEFFSKLALNSTHFSVPVLCRFNTEGNYTKNVYHWLSISNISFPFNPITYVNISGVNGLRAIPPTHINKDCHFFLAYHIIQDTTDAPPYNSHSPTILCKEELYMCDL